MNERNENVLSAEKEETFLSYLNSHVKTVHDEEKNNIFELFLWIQNNQIWMKEMQNHVKIFYQQKKHSEKEETFVLSVKKLFESKTKFNPHVKTVHEEKRKPFLSFSLENYSNQNSNWISIFEQSIKKIKPL